MRIAFLVSLLALAATPSALAQDEIPREIQLAEAEVAGWRLDAWIETDTVTYPDGPLPVIGSVVCLMEHEKGLLEIRLYNLGGVSLHLRDGEHEASEITSLQLGDTTWEYRESWTEADRQFADVDYPPPRVVEPCGGRKGHDIILYGCGVAKASAPRVRRSADEPWLGLTTLANELYRAPSIRIGYGPGDAGEEETREVEVPLDGLKQATAWCETTFQSDAARRLRAG